MLAYTVAEKLYKGRMPQDIPMEDRAFQNAAVEKLKIKKRHILGLPMGAGKTPVAVRTLKNWNPGRSLIIPTERAILAWLKTMWVWYPELLYKYTIISKKYKREVRHEFWKDNAKHPNLNVITNFQLLVRDGPFLPTHFDAIMLDEYHKFMRNRGTGMHNVMKRVKSDNLLLVTGSPASRGAQDYFVPLNIIDPRLFSSYWKFVSTWCNVTATMHGKDVWGTRNEEAFRRMLYNYAIVATKKELGLQKKQRDIMRVEMSDTQAKAYSAIRDDFLLELQDGPAIVLLNTLTQYIKMRQILACPATIAPELGIGGGAETILETLLDLPVNERHATIFTPFKGGLPYLKAFFEGRGRSLGLPENGTNVGVPVYIFFGGMGMDALFDTLYEFKKNGGLAICTTQFAESFDMETVATAFMLGADWDPQVNFQAEDRLDRLNNPHGLINIYYLMNEGTIDEDILYTLTMKQTNVNKLYSQRNIMMEALSRTV